MQLGFALTQHCNLRCPHCIRDDVTTVRALSLPFMRSALDQAVELFPELSVSLTGGEPLLHPDFGAVIELLRERGIGYRFVSNGWHIRRVLKTLERHPPEFVRLSLSGGSEAVHDAERGRDSFRRVLIATAVLTSRGIPTSFSLVIDRRSRHEIAMAAELAESVGCLDIHMILPQPTPGSAARDSDLPMDEWLGVRREVEALARIPDRRTAVVLDYGAPFEGEETSCGTMQLERIYVDAHGRVATCCQLSDYGSNETEVVADLASRPLADVFEDVKVRMAELARLAARDVSSNEPIDRFPCMRCAKVTGKLDWLNAYPQSAWSGVVRGRVLPVVG